AKLAGSGQPRYCEAAGQFPVKRRRRDVQIAVIVPDHPPVLKRFEQIPLGEYTLREKRPEKFVSHNTVVCFPIRVRTLQGHCAGICVPASPECHPLVEVVIKCTADGYLVRVLNCPDKRRILKLWTEQPALRKQHDTMQLEVSARIHGNWPAQVIS